MYNRSEEFINETLGYEQLNEIKGRGSKMTDFLFGLMVVGINLVFAIWASFGKAWYIYLLNFILLFVASSMINTSYIQGLTRGFSYIFLYGRKGIPKALRINIPTIIFSMIAYIITRFVFSIGLQYALFFMICIALSTIVALVDNQFQVAIRRTQAFEEIEKAFQEAKRKREVTEAEILKWPKNKHLVVSGADSEDIHHIYIDDSKYAIFCPKVDLLTTDVFIGTPTGAKEWRRYDGNGNLLFSKKLNDDFLEWEIYEDIILYQGKILSRKGIPYLGEVVEVETFNENIDDQWIVSKIREIYSNL